jgi:F-type H+-transporting ATPase subunit b
VAFLVLAVVGLGLGSAAAAPRMARASTDEAERLAGAEVAEQPPGEEVHPAPEIHVKSLLLQILNFGVLVFLLVKFGGPAVSKALTARHQQLKTELAAASEARAAAQARLERQEVRLAALEHEIAAIRAGIKQEAEVEKARLIEIAEERAGRIKAETVFLMEQQVKEAKAELQREAARAAVDLAEQMVRRSLNAGDQQRLVDTFVSDVAAGAPKRVS